ncbi:hypothetical protein M378DRAFT_168009 [Amanita muscaria Koide BX008]|uniref:Uncharacterized protein n=1 Tax=Amanita muscaria (strain Koide BX008) TaxID=946122 RepID=A0A0C2WUR8_AMAMK|nr:hypothetical protein M378DRAFT_168009 [Amanita muscaria Koide BX008]
MPYVRSSTVASLNEDGDIDSLIEKTIHSIRAVVYRGLLYCAGFVALAGVAELIRWNACEDYYLWLGRG